MRKVFYPYLFILPAIILVAVLLLYPIGLNINYGFQEIQMFAGTSQNYVGIRNYVELFKTSVFRIAVKNTFIFTFASIIVQFILALPLALLLNEQLPARGLARGLALVPWMVPHIVAALTWTWMLDGSLGIINDVLVKLGLLQSYKYWLSDPSLALGAVTLINIWKGIPFNLIVLLAGLQTIPEVLYEAAKIDGASGLQRFRNITLPLLRPQIAVLFILGTIWTFRNFDLIFITTGGGPVNATEVLATLAYKYSFDFFQMGRGAAVANTMFVILMIFTIIYARFLEDEIRFD